MEPIRPNLREKILAADPSAENDINEYERLLAARFTYDPDLGPAGDVTAAAAVDVTSGRLQELRDRLTSLLPTEDWNKL